MPCSSARELHIQVSLLACLAVQQDDPIPFLARHLAYHNITELFHDVEGPVKHLLLISDPRAELVPGLQARPKLEPTVYIAFDSDVRDLTGFAPNSVANFYCDQATSGFVLAEEACIQALIAHVLASMPFQLFFNLLGQGYTLVLTGHKFGGALANALAAQLLLQLRQEVLVAESAGINMAALSLTANKVFSYGFGAPFYGDRQLQAALQQHELEQQVNTIWQQHDASVRFFSLCGELFVPGHHSLQPPYHSRITTHGQMHRLPSMGACQHSNNESAFGGGEVMHSSGTNAGPPRQSSSSLDPDPDMEVLRISSRDQIGVDRASSGGVNHATAPTTAASAAVSYCLDAAQVKSAQFVAVQNWSTAVVAELKKLEATRPAVAHLEHFATAPLPTGGICLRESVREREEAFASASAAHGRQTSHTQLRLQVDSLSLPDSGHDRCSSPVHAPGSPTIRTSGNSRKSLEAAARASSGTPVGVDIAATGLSSPKAAASPASKSNGLHRASTGLPSSTTSKSTAAGGAKAATVTRPGSLPPHRMSSNGKLGMPPTFNGAAAAATAATAFNGCKKTLSMADKDSNAAALAAARTGATGTWRPALAALLTWQAQLQQQRYQPLGAFWLLSPLPVAANSRASSLNSTANGSTINHGSNSSSSKADSHAADVKVGHVSCSGQTADVKDGDGQRFTLELLQADAEAVVTLSKKWLQADNPHLFSKWEATLGELRSELMEAFTWVGFKTTFMCDGELLDRTQLLKPARLGFR